MALRKRENMDREAMGLEILKKMDIEAEMATLRELTSACGEVGEACPREIAGPLVARAKDLVDQYVPQRDALIKTIIAVSTLIVEMKKTAKEARATGSAKPD